MPYVEKADKTIQHLMYKGKEIFYTDYRGLDDDEMTSAVHEVVDYLLDLNRPTLQLTNITGVYFTPKILKLLTTLTPRVEHLIIKDAVVGVTGAKRVLFQAYNAIVNGNAKTFDDEQTAKDWLVGD